MDGRQPAGPKQCGPAIPFSHEDARRRHGLLQVAGREPISPHDVAGLWRVDLSRLETEWLIACFYGSSRLLPRDVRERLEFLGLIDGGVRLTAAGRRWLDEWRDGSGGGRPGPRSSLKPRSG